MKIEQLYDKIAGTYNQQLSADILQQSSQLALDSIARIKQPTQLILGLGIGDGKHFSALKALYPEADYYGLDISQKMLSRAQAYLDCHTIHGDVAHASDLIESRNFDLITAHFICAYVPLDTILKQSKQLMAKTGHLSVLTNTMQSFPQLQYQFQQMQTHVNPFTKCLVNNINRAISQVHVPKTVQQLQQTIENSGFTIDDIRNKEFNVEFTNHQQMYDFFINGGWFVSGLDHPLLPHSWTDKIIRYALKHYVKLPYQDSLTITCVTCRQ